MKIQNKQVSSVRKPTYTTKQNQKAFTLVELIVVITILAILGTIAFISLQGYSAQARDSKRLGDIANIKKSLELFSLNTGRFPKPDNNFTVSYSGEILRYQGIVGDQVSINLSKNLNEKPVDPTIEVEYIYSTTHSQTEYEVLGLYESDLIGMDTFKSLFVANTKKGIVSSINAATQNYPKIDGNYNGIYIKTSNFYVPTPSIINAEIVSSDDLDDDVIKSQVITGGDNLPLMSTGWLNINLSVYNGTITEDSTDEDKTNLVEIIQLAYSGSQLASKTMYADILSKTSTGEMVDFVDLVVLNRTNLSSSSVNDDSVNDDVDFYENCTSTGEILTATTTYPGCDTADIIVCSGVGAGYTIAACNVGATIAGTDNTNENTIGKYFQWGRNDGFDYNGGAILTTTATLYTGTQHIEGGINLSSNGTYTDKFIVASSTYTYNWLSKTGETTDPGWGQGPCPTGYHVPSQLEWSGIVTAGQWGTNGAAIRSALKLPYAGRRDRSNGSFSHSTSGFYWSSSLHDAFAYTLYFYSTNLGASYTFHRAYGYSVRCFKN